MIRTVPETGSTNADLAARLRAGEHVAEGEWLIADRQHAGKGRLGRAWCDGSGNFMGSTVVHPGPGDPPPSTLALVAGLAVHAAVADAIAPPTRPLLKWPNDVMIGTAKLAGILLEAVGNSVVVGIGVNLAVAPELPDRETIALSAFGPPPDRDTFAANLAHLFDVELERWRSYGLAPIVARWTAAAHAPGTALQIGEPGEPPLDCTYAGLADDGGLLVRLADGSMRAIHAGEVRLGAPERG